MWTGANFVKHDLVEGWSTNDCESAWPALFAPWMLVIPLILVKTTAVQSLLARSANQPQVLQLASLAVRVTSALILVKHVVPEVVSPRLLATFDALNHLHYLDTSLRG